MPIFIATCGPTGIGKTYQMQRLMTRDPRRFSAVLSVTTRPWRGPEDGEWYRFVSRESLKDLDPADVISDVTFRDERYILLRSEIEKAMARAPIAFMAIVPSVIMLMRTKKIPHSLICCKVGNPVCYEERLRQRGYSGEKLMTEKATGIAFEYPASDPEWPQQDVLLGSAAEDDTRFNTAVAAFAGNLFLLD